ncbi:hypothetical protein ACFL01_04155 [Planctomycetota bacterium]
MTRILQGAVCIIAISVFSTLGLCGDSLLTPEKLAASGKFLAREALSEKWVPVRGSMKAGPFSGKTKDLELTASFASRKNHTLVQGTVRNLAGGERGVTVSFRLPVDADGWRFGRTMLASERIEGDKRFCEWTYADRDWDGRWMNRGMFSPLYSDTTGLALGAVSTHPQVFRVSYARKEGFAIEIDLGLSSLPEKFPDCATFEFVIFRFEPEWGYRAALATYMEMFPEDYRVRAEKFGSWTGAASLNKIDARAADYAVMFDSHGARYFEHSVKEGVYIFEYAKGYYTDVPVYAATKENRFPSRDMMRRAVRLYWTSQSRDTEQGWKREPPGATAAQMERNSYTEDANGEMNVWTAEGPYNYKKNLYPNGYFITSLPVNPDPELASPNQGERILNWSFGVPFREAQAGKFPLHGHHFDGWGDFAGRYLENTRPDHLKKVDYPLTFSYTNGRPVQFHLFMWQEFTRSFAEYLHSQDMMLFANARPWRTSMMFEQGIVDVHGGFEQMERNLDYMAFMRTLVGNKPISGNGIGQSGGEPLKKYTERELAQFERDLNILITYCWFPGRFGPKDLWQKYCFSMQEMATAAWEPVTGAKVSHPDLLVERYGGVGDDTVFYLVHNRSEKRVRYDLTVDLSVPGLTASAAGLKERLYGESPEARLTQGNLVLRNSLSARQSHLLEIVRKGGGIKIADKVTGALTPPKSTVSVIGRPDPDGYRSRDLPGVIKTLGLRPETLRAFLGAYETEKLELGGAVVFHLNRELKDHPEWKTDPKALQKAAEELTAWLVRKFGGIYESVLPGPTNGGWSGLRYAPNRETPWKMEVEAGITDDGVTVKLRDPMLETTF